MDFYKKHLRLLSAVNGLAYRMGLSSAFICAAFASQNVAAIEFGVYDSRSLAMGGAGVASATGSHAQFYNPALLAFYDGKEEDTRNGRVYLPMVVGQVSDNVQDTLDVVDDNLDDRLNAAVTAYNAAPTDNAAITEVLNASAALRIAIQPLINQELKGEAFVGMSVSEPSDREGGSFYFGSRVIAGGTSTVTQDDLDLLDDYIETMEYFANGAVGTQPHPELIVGGNLLDPSDLLTSSADISSLIITEWGVAVSKEFEFWGQPVALGITPKAMRVDVYRDNLTYGNSDYSYEDDKRSYYSMNADLGIAVPLGDYFRLGLAMKDVLTHSYSGANNMSVSVEPRTRFAAAFVQKYITVALDVDLQKQSALGAGEGSQDLSLGMELNIIPWVHFRGGYRQDLEGIKANVMSAGVGFRVGRFVTDAAYSFSSEATGGGLQLGWMF